MNDSKSGHFGKVFPCIISHLQTIFLRKDQKRKFVVTNEIDDVSFFLCSVRSGRNRVKREMEKERGTEVAFKQ